VEALIYLDTHVVAWLYAGRTDLFTPRAIQLLNDEELRICPAVVLEIEYLHETHRIAVAARAMVQSLTAQVGLRVCDLPSPAIIESALDLRWTRDPFDRMIVGHAALAGSIILTKDRVIRKHYRKATW